MATFNYAKYANYAQEPTNQLTRNEYSYCTTFEVDNFSLDFFGDDLIKFPDIQLVGYDETW